MDCPNCGYAMTPFDKECPRCLRMELQNPHKSSPQPQTPITPPVINDQVIYRTGTTNSIRDNTSTDQVKASDYPSYYALLITGILIPLAGFIIGLVLLNNQEAPARKAGQSILIGSIVTFFVCLIISLCISIFLKFFIA